ncbi:MAG: hypothetical protein JWO55_571 [Candidatus Saccharibacteria bacterium]|jgi:hypothetical protein|nr:hypothetical protein [Candidatus Saccharibacteria bacterium]
MILIIMHNKENDFNNSLPEHKEGIRHHLEWGATPLTTIGRQDVAGMQLRVFDALIDRTEKSAPIDVPEELRQFVLHSFMNRFHGRAQNNQISYSERLKQDFEGLDPLILNMHERAITGQATPVELLIVRREFGLRSIELARLTHPYGDRIEQLDRMRHAVEYGILANDGIVFKSEEDQDVRYKIRSLSRDAETPEEIKHGFLMTRRRKIGVEGDDTHIHERSSFVVRMDEVGGLDVELINEMSKVKLTKDETWIEDIAAAVKLEEIIPALLKKNNFHTIIPLSTTVYAYNKTTGAEIEREKERNRDRMEMSQYPELQKHIANLALNRTDDHH